MAGAWVSFIWRIVRSFEARVLIALTLVAGAVLAFLEIAEEVAEGETHAVDRSIVLLFRTPGDLNDPIGSRNVEEAVRDVTALGGTTVVTLVTILAILAFVFQKRFRHALVMGAAVLLATLSSDIIKAVLDRPRPDLVPHGAYVYSASFPSGHSTLATTTYLTLAMLVASLEPHRSTKALAYGVAAVVLVGVGVSRVYLGVHWPSDVLAGWCLGSAWALVAWAALRLIGGKTRG